MGDVAWGTPSSMLEYLLLIDSRKMIAFGSVATGDVIRLQQTFPSDDHTDSHGYPRGVKTQNQVMILEK